MEKQISYKNFERQFKKRAKRLKKYSSFNYERWEKVCKHFILFIHENFKLKKLDDLHDKHLTAYKEFLFSTKMITESQWSLIFTSIQLMHDLSPTRKHYDLLDNHQVYIFTDGSCTNNGRKNSKGGWGAILKYKEHEKELSSIGEHGTTNNIMEIKAVIHSLQAIKSTNIPIVIYTDSLYIAECMNKQWYIKWERFNWMRFNGDPVKNKDLWIQLLKEVKRQKTVKFIHIFGHSGIEANEKADKLAKKSRKLASAI